MRTPLFLLVPLLVLGSAGCHHPVPGPLTDARTAALRDTLVALDSTMNQAVDGLDCATAMRYIGDEQPLFISGGHVVETHAQLATLCDALVAPRTGARFVARSVTAHILSPDAGYVVRDGEYTVHLKSGQSRSEHLAMTTIWARRAGAWRMVHLHESMIPTPSPN